LLLPPAGAPSTRAAVTPPRQSSQGARLAPARARHIVRSAQRQPRPVPARARPSASSRSRRRDPVPGPVALVRRSHTARAVEPAPSHRGSSPVAYCAATAARRRCRHASGPSPKWAAAPAPRGRSRCARRPGARWAASTSHRDSCPGGARCALPVPSVPAQSAGPRARPTRCPRHVPAFASASTATAPGSHPGRRSSPAAVPSGRRTPRCSSAGLLPGSAVVTGPPPFRWTGVD
jgi:hypothetical protein